MATTLDRDAGGSRWPEPIEPTGRAVSLPFLAYATTEHNGRRAPGPWAAHGLSPLARFNTLQRLFTEVTMRTALLGLLFGALLAPSAYAEPACPAGNLLAGKKPTTVAVSRAGRLVDGALPKEGANWNTTVTAVLGGTKAAVTWDLGAPTRIDALLVQGDNNDTYQVSLSADGKTFSPLWTVPQAPNPGMRTRLTQGLNAEARYLRLHGAKGDNAYSIGEIQAFCQMPSPWPPALKRTSGASKAPKNSRKRRMAQSKMTFGLFALIAFLGLALSRRTRGDPWLANAGTLWAIGGLAAMIFFDRNGYGAAALGAAANLAAGGFLAWRLKREDADHARLGLGVAAFGGYTTLIYAAWRMREEIAGRISEANPYLFKANFIWVVIALLAPLLIIVITRLIKNVGTGRLARNSALLAVIIGSGLTWTNFGSFHGSRAVHYWDSFHYYMGSKYFKETRYHLLYHCAAIGEVDDGRKEEFKKRKIRDLRNNTLLPAMPQLERTEECRANFTPERWAAFRQDLRLFRSKMGSAWWKKMFKDHGYNASPVWNMMGNAFANASWADHVPPADLTNAPANLRGKSPAERRAIRDDFAKKQVPAFEDRIQRLALIDGALYIGIFLLIAWAFGLEICALAIAILAVGYPWAYFWTGGGYGRVPWLFMATLGVCAMKRGWAVLGGFAVTWGTLLRVFPGAIAFGVVLKVGWNLVTRRTIIKSHRRIIIGAVAALAVLIPASLPSSDGIEAYQEFLGNSMKHKKTPLTNHMGLPALVAWSPSLIARNTKNSRLEDPFKIWKEKRLESLEKRKLLHYAILAAFLALILLCGSRMEDWEATAISSLMIIGIFDLTCYYYNFIILWAPVVMRRVRYTVAFMLMAIFTQFIQLKVGWYDEQYLWETALVLGVLLYILGDIAWRLRAQPEQAFPDQPLKGPLAWFARLRSPRPLPAPDTGTPSSD